MPSNAAPTLSPRRILAMATLALPGAADGDGRGRHTGAFCPLTSVRAYTYYCADSRRRNYATTSMASCAHTPHRFLMHPCRLCDLQLLLSWQGAAHPYAGDDPRRATATALTRQGVVSIVSVASLVHRADPECIELSGHGRWRAASRTVRIANKVSCSHATACQLSCPKRELGGRLL